MTISEKKMQIVINNYFKAECTVNTSIRDAFEKGFRIGVQKGYDVTKGTEQKWIPVTEALPKVRTDVLMAFEKNMAVGFYSHDCWNVNTGNGFYTGVFTDENKPIAWMPLPEPWGKNNE